MRLREYYKQADLWLPKFSRWRMFKFRLWNKEVINVFNIKNKKDLRKVLLVFQPRDVWFGVSGWLNPKQVRGKLSSSFMLFRDLPFDIDAEVEKNKKPTIKQLEEARVKTLKVYEYLKPILGEPSYILFSGNKGFHIYYENSQKTFKFLQEKKHKEIKDLIDFDITEDEYRVVRLPLTINGASGIPAFFITPKDLNKSISLLLRRVAPILPKTITSNLRITTSNPPYVLCDDRDSPMSQRTLREEGGYDGRKPSQLDKRKAGGGNGLTEPAKITYYLTNKISGTKKYILFLKYKKRWEKIRNELAELQERYSIGNVYILNYKDGLGVLGLKAHDIRRLEKIYRASTSINKGYFLKRKLALIPIAETRLINGELKTKRNCSPLFFVGLQSDNDYDIYSSPHKEMLEGLGFIVREKKNFIGKENIIWEREHDNR